MKNLIGRTIFSAILGSLLFVAVATVTRITIPPLGFALFAYPLIPWVLCSAVAWRLLRKFKIRYQPKRPPDNFKPAFKHEKIALDTESNRLWIVPDEGEPLLLKPADILGWDHTWVDTHNAIGMLFHLNNRIRFRLNDFERPIATIRFGKENKTALDWHARLTKWLNH